MLLKLNSSQSSIEHPKYHIRNVLSVESWSKLLRVVVYLKPAVDLQLNEIKGCFNLESNNSLIMSLFVAKLDRATVLNEGHAKPYNGLYLKLRDQTSSCRLMTVQKWYNYQLTK